MILNSCFLVSISLIAAVGIVAWYRYCNLEPWQRQAYLSCQFESPIGMIDFVTGFFIWLGLPTIAIAVLSSYWQVESLDGLDGARTNTLMIVLSSTQLIAFLLIVGILGIRYGFSNWLLGRVSDWPHQILFTLKAFCMVVPLVLTIQALLSALVPYEHETLDQLAENFSLATVLATSLGAVVAAPLGEELLFRGLLQSWLQRIDFRRSDPERIYEFIGGWDHADARGKIEVVDETHKAPGLHPVRWWLPVVVSSLLFALIHLGQGAAPIPLFFFALALGFLYRYSGSLFPCIVLHFLLNAFTMFWTMLNLYFGNSL